MELELNDPRYKAAALEVAHQNNGEVQMWRMRETGDLVVIMKTGQKYRPARLVDIDMPQANP